MDEPTEDPFQDIIDGLPPTPIDEDGIMPPPGYWSGRVEVELDLLQMEAKRVDEQGLMNVDGMLTAQLMAHQWRVNYFMTLARMSIGYYSAMAPSDDGDDAEVVRFAATAEVDEQS